MPKETAERIIDYPYTASARRGGSSSVGSGVGASAFLGLTDTPSTFAGADGYYVTVDESGGRLLFTALPAIPADFTDLGDVPSSYSGHSLKLVRVNAGETALEFFTSSGAGYTQEEIEDFVAAQFTGNTGVIDATYDDGTGAITLTLDVSAADRYLYSTGADAWAEGTITAFMRGLLDDADAATARTTLGVTVYDQETAEDVVGASITDGNGINATYDDGAGTVTLALTTLTSDWDIGEDRAIQAEIIKARDAEGLWLYTDGATSGLFVDDTGRIGGGPGFSGTPAQALHIVGATGNNVSDIPIRLDRVTPNTTSTVTSGYFAAISTGDMVDTFGPLYNFIIRDTAAVDNIIARFGAVRDGGDLYGSFVIYTANNATAAERVRVTPDGRMIIGLTSAGASKLGIQAGSSSNDAAVGGVLYVDSSAAATDSGSPVTLATYTLPANTLAVNGQSIWIEIFGTVSTGGLGKLLDVIFGGTTIASFSVSAPTEAGFNMRCRVMRTGSATQVASSVIVVDGTVTATSSSPAETLSGSVVIDVDGRTGTAGQFVTVTGMIVGWDDANS